MSKRDPLVLLEDIMLAIQKIGRYTSQMDSLDADCRTTKPNRSRLLWSGPSIIWEIIQHDLPGLEKQVRALQK